MPHGHRPPQASRERGAHEDCALVGKPADFPAPGRESCPDWPCPPLLLNSGPASSALVLNWFANSNWRFAIGSLILSKLVLNVLIIKSALHVFGSL